MYKRIILILLMTGSLFSQDLKEFFDKGENYLKMKDYKSAISEFNNYIQKDEKNAAAFYNRGLAYMFLNDFEIAIHDFNIAIRIDSTFPDAFNNRGLCYSYIEDNEWALKDYNKAIKLDTNFAEAYLNRASIHIFNKNYEPAIKDLTRAAKLSPKNPEIYSQRARLYYFQNKFKKSIDDYTTAIKMGIKHYKIFYNRGNSYFKAGKFKEAIEDYTIALKTAPEDMEILNNRSAAYHASGKDDLAKKDKNTMLKINSNYFPAVESLKWKTISDLDSLIYLELPATWNKSVYNNDGNKEIIVTPENVSVMESGFSVGVTIGVVKNVSKLYKVETEQDILDFWKGSTNENTKDLHFYSVEFEKTKRIFGHSSLLVKARLQASSKHIKMGMYEYIIAWGDNLFYIYLQAPDDQFEYYAAIFAKAMESVRFDEGRLDAGIEK